MKKIKIGIFSLLFLSFSSWTFSQTDSEFINDSIQLSKYIDSIRIYYNTDHEKAYQIALEGMTRFVDTEYSAGMIWLLHFLTEINYFYKNRFDSSLVYLNRMRSLSDSIGLPRGEAWYELHLGNIYYYQNDLVRAMQLYRSARKNADKIQDSIIITDALIGIADILMQWGELDNSLKYLYEAHGYAISIKKLRMQFLVYDDIANIYKLTEKYDSSYNYYQKTFEIATEQKNVFGILVSDLNLSYIKYLLGSDYDIIPHLKYLQAESEKQNFMRLYLDIGFTMCEILQDQGRYKEAYDLYQETFALRDSIIGNEGIRQVAEIESHYYLRKRELENRELMRQNEVNSLKLRNRVIVIFLSVFMLIQAIILLLIISRKYRTIKQNLKTIKEQERKIFDQEKQILQKEKEAIELKLQYKEKENMAKAMKVFNHNQLTQNIINELSDIKKSIKESDCREEVNSKLQSMINELNISLNDHMWKEFETIFMESNPGYLNKLTEQFPNLSPNEIKLCILLYLNLRTKDITTITRQSIKSINVARTRLRKKLHLENTNISISSFLNRIN